MLKYRISEQIGKRQVETGLKQSKIKSQLREELDISLSHLNHLIKLKIDDKSSISVDQLLTMATFFGCEVEDLITKPTKSQSNGEHRTFHREGQA